jgi:hypothetical protein
MAKKATSAFKSGAGKTAADESEQQRARLHAKIGQQAVKLDWLTKKSKQLVL